MADPDKKSNRDDDGKPEEPAKPNGKSSNPLGRWPLGWVLLIGLAVVMLLVLSTGQGKAEKITWQQFKQFAVEGGFKDGEVISEDDKFIAELDEDATRPEGIDDSVVRVSTDVKPDNLAYRTLLLDELNAQAEQGEKPSADFEAIQFRESVNRTGLFWMFVIQWGPLFLIACPHLLLHLPRDARRRRWPGRDARQLRPIQTQDADQGTLLGHTSAMSRASMKPKKKSRRLSNSSATPKSSNAWAAASRAGCC